MGCFSELPVELVEHIASYLGQPALYAISQVRQSLYTIVIPLLYRHVDLLINPGHHLPRIDRFCFNVLNDAKLGDHVRSLRIGRSLEGGVQAGPRFLPNDSKMLGQTIYRRALEFLKLEASVWQGEDLRSALGAREYGAYAALLLLVLPSINSLYITDRRDETLRPLHCFLTNIVKAEQREALSSRVAARIASIKHVSYNFDWKFGMRPDDLDDNTKVWQVLPFPGLRKLEFPNTDKNLRCVNFGSILPRACPQKLVTRTTAPYTEFGYAVSKQNWRKSTQTSDPIL
jgi:hypothetical protein